jgi:hypothetical protein
VRSSPYLRWRPSGRVVPAPRRRSRVSGRDHEVREELEASTAPSRSRSGPTRGTRSSCYPDVERPGHRPLGGELDPGLLRPLTGDEYLGVAMRCGLKMVALRTEHWPCGSRRCGSRRSSPPACATCKRCSVGVHQAGSCVHRAHVLGCRGRDQRGKVINQVPSSAASPRGASCIEVERHRLVVREATGRRHASNGIELWALYHVGLLGGVSRSETVPRADTRAAQHVSGDRGGAPARSGP